MKWLLALLLLALPANAQIVTTLPSATGGATSPGGTPGQVQYNNSGAFGGFTPSGDATINTTTGAVAVTKTGGVAFATSATTDTTNASNITSGSLAQTRIAASTLTAGTSATLVAPRAYFICTGTCTITLPVPVAGYEFCIINDNNVATAITLAALGSSARYENTARTAYGTAGTGTMVSTGVVGDKICLVGRDATHYIVGSFQGTWTAS